MKTARASAGPVRGVGERLHEWLLLERGRLARRHAVADAALGEEVSGIVGTVAELAAQALHHVADGPRLPHPLWTPDPLQQEAVGQHARRAHRQIVKSSLGN